MTKVTRMTQKSGRRLLGPHEAIDAAGDQGRGPMRTLKVGDRITVFGDIELISIDGRRVEVRLYRASSPPPAAMFVVRPNNPGT